MKNGRKEKNKKKSETNGANRGKKDRGKGWKKRE